MSSEEISLLDGDGDLHVQNADARDDGSSVTAIEGQIRNLWGEIENLRSDATVKDTIKNLELIRMIEIHNQLDIEEQRKMERYTKSFIDSLKLHEIGVQPSIQGGVKCRLQAHKANSRNSYDPSFAQHGRSLAEEAEVSHIAERRQEVISNRKAEITATLIELNRRKALSPEEERLKFSLMEELKTLQ